MILDQCDCGYKKKKNLNTMSGNEQVQFFSTGHVQTTCAAAATRTLMQAVCLKRRKEVKQTCDVTTPQSATFRQGHIHKNCFKAHTAFTISINIMGSTNFI